MAVTGSLEEDVFARGQHQVGAEMRLIGPLLLAAAAGADALFADNGLILRLPSITVHPSPSPRYCWLLAAAASLIARSLARPQTDRQLNEDGRTLACCCCCC